MTDVCVCEIVKMPFSLWPNISNPTASKWAGIKNGNSPLISSEHCKGTFIIGRTWYFCSNPQLSPDGEPIASNWLNNVARYVLLVQLIGLDVKPHLSSVCPVDLVSNLSRERYVLSPNVAQSFTLLTNRVNLVITFTGTVGSQERCSGEAGHRVGLSVLQQDSTPTWDTSPVCTCSPLSILYLLNTFASVVSTRKVSQTSLKWWMLSRRCRENGGYGPRKHINTCSCIQTWLTVSLCGYMG